MKKILLFASALAGLFLAGSCQRENLEPAAQGGVTYEISLPTGPQTKGEAGYELYDLYYEVYRINGTAIDKLYHNRVDMPKEGLNLPLDLLNDQTYTVIFWAQEKGSPWIDASDLQNIKLEESLSNNDHRDAFCAVDANFLHDGAQSRKVTLTRPFAQVNIATTVNNVGYDITPKQSLVTFKNIPTGYNLLNGETNATTEVTFGLNGIPGNKITVNGTSYTTVAMNYVLVADSNIDEVYYEIQTDNGTVKNTIPSVPVKKNYRTNIIGNLLTSNATYTIEIKPGFATPDEVVGVWDGSSVTEPTVETDATTGETVYVVDEASDLAWLAQIVNGTLTRAATVAEYNFKLTADIDLGNHPWTPIGFNPNEKAGNEKYYTGTFDGNGHTIKNLYIDVKDQGGVGFFGAIHNATIKNVTFENVFVKAVESEDDPANTSGAEGRSDYIVGGHIGAVAGYDAKAGEITFENVHVKGLVKIEGETRAAQGQRIGGIFGGRGSSNITFNNVSVKGTEGSYIKGYCSTAGVSGQIQGVATYDNVHTDIDVYAVTFGAGGIAGIVMHGSTFNNCSSAGDITLDASRTQLSSYSANYPYRVAGIAGCWSESKTGVLELTSCSYTGTLTSIDKDGNSPEAFDYAGYVGRGYNLNGCAGSKVSINGVEYVQVYDKAAESGLYYVNGEYTIASAANLQVFANKVNAGETFAGKTVVLANDIDLNNIEWTPIGQTGATEFMGTFDGKGKTISNLNIDATAQTGAHYSSGLFGWLYAATVKNVNVAGATVKGNHNVGVIAGYLEAAGCTIEACHVTGAAVECHNANADANGDKCGVIVGNAPNAGTLVKDCTAANSTVSAGRDAGQIVGAALEANVTGCSATNVTVTANDEGTSANIRNEVIGRIL